MAPFSKENLNFKFGEGTLHTSNSRLSFETVDLENIDCNDVLKYVPHFVHNFLVIEGKSNAKVEEQVSKP